MRGFVFLLYILPISMYMTILEICGFRKSRVEGAWLVGSVGRTRAIEGSTNVHKAKKFICHL